MKQILIILSCASSICLSGCLHKSTRELIREAGQGNAGAQLKVGTLYKDGRQGLGLRRNYAQAEKWYLMAAGQGDAEAQYKLARLYDDENWKPPEEKMKWYCMAAEQGHMEAQYMLGFSYRYPLFSAVPEDPAEAARWFRKAAEQGHAAAQYEIGLCYLWCLGGVRPSATEAEKLFRMNDTEAERWFRLAAGQGNKDAQRQLHHMDRFETVLAAARSGDADAQYDLGGMYEAGAGVAQDHGMAEYWYCEAARQGNKMAIRTIHRDYPHARARLKPDDKQADLAGQIKDAIYLSPPPSY